MKPSVKASPSEAVCSSQSTTMWPRNAYCMFQDGIANTRLPVEPGLAQEFGEEPGIDVAAFVVAHVDDQPLAIEDWIEFARPLIDIVRAHGLQVNIADCVVRGGVHHERREYSHSA